MVRLLLVMVAILWSMPAQARRLPLDPENRVHLGVALTDNTSLSLTGGLDSRLTRMVSVDVGGFVSPIPLPDSIVPTSADGKDYIFLRHGIYVTPGFRVPHRQPKALQWDVVGRFGFAAVFSNDVHPDNSTTPNERFVTEANPAFLGGLEVDLRHEHVGLRLAPRAFFSRPFSQFEGRDLVMLQPQYAAELFYQW